MSPIGNHGRCDNHLDIGFGTWSLPLKDKSKGQFHINPGILKFHLSLLAKNWACGRMLGATYWGKGLTGHVIEGYGPFTPLKNPELIHHPTFYCLRSRLQRRVGKGRVAWLGQEVCFFSVPEDTKWTFQTFDRAMSQLWEKRKIHIQKAEGKCDGSGKKIILILCKLIKVSWGQIYMRRTRSMLNLGLCGNYIFLHN